jgi:hypothetical protein
VAIRLGGWATEMTLSVFFLLTGAPEKHTTLAIPPGIKMGCRTLRV